MQNPYSVRPDIRQMRKSSPLTFYKYPTDGIWVLSLGVGSGAQGGEPAEAGRGGQAAQYQGTEGLHQ